MTLMIQIVADNPPAGGYTSRYGRSGRCVGRERYDVQQGYEVEAPLKSTRLGFIDTLPPCFVDL